MANPIYTVSTCNPGSFVTSITLYASASYYNSGPVNYIGAPDPCVDPVQAENRNARVLWHFMGNLSAVLSGRLMLY